MNENYNILISKLDEFIRKYYKNLLIRGLLLFIGIFFVFFLAVTLIEYYGNFNTTVRTVLFYSYIAINAFVLWRLVIIPVFSLLKIGKIISHQEAAKIIGSHFTDVQDKLLNVIQLREMEDKPTFESRELIQASIDQKIEKLKPVPFKKAIDLSVNRKYLKYTLPPLILFLLLFITVPRVVTEPTTRLVRHTEYFEKKAPFTITVLNDKLEAIQQEDFTLEVRVEGEELPAEVFLDIHGLKYRLSKDNAVKFHYNFVNLQADLTFYIIAAEYRSAEYVLKVLPKPIVLSFETSLDYPGYTGKSDETLENTGDLVVPEGTTVNWKFYTRDTRRITFSMAGKPALLESGASNTFEFSSRIVDNLSYSVSTSNDFIQSKDSLVYAITIIPDLYPSITVDSYQDSIYDKRLYFKGVIKDDYGFANLTFNYILLPGGLEPEVVPEINVKTLAFSRNTTQEQFFYFFDLDSIALVPGDEVEYYFEVWDNDGVNGSKKTRSQKMTFKAPTDEEIEKEDQVRSENLKSDMEDAIEDLQDLQKDIDELTRKMAEKESLGWQEKQQLQQLVEKQKDIESRIEKIQKENEIKSLREQQYKEMDEELFRKQQQLEDLFEKVMDEEMKKMFEELQKLMDEVDKDKVREMLDEMKMSNEELEKEIDRNLELFKQLEVEKMLQDAIDKLDELTKKQQELSGKSENEEISQEQLKQEQDKLNEEFEKWREDVDDLHKKNEELENPNNLEKTDSEEEEIGQEMENSSDELNQGNRRKASQSQKNAAQGMQQLGDKLKAMQGDMYMENMGEDIRTLREILENLIQLSYDEESLMADTRATSPLDPRYPELMQQQKQIKDDLQMVEDSLWALSKRQPMIEPLVTKEIENINRHVDRALEGMNDRKLGEATGDQQFVMTSINNLALLLSEALQQMMNAMQMQSSGQCSKGCPKPGGGSPSMTNMRKMQEQLNKQLQQMKEGMQKQGQGQKPQQNGQPSMSEQLARMAAEQAAIRKMMDEYQEELKKEGYGNSKELDQLTKDMEKTETELVNKIVTQQMLERQKEILTRLLKHEKAEMEREREEKRESREAKDYIYSNPNEFLEYNRMKDNETELLKTIPPNLTPFFKSKVNEYFFNFEVR